MSFLEECYKEEERIALKLRSVQKLKHYFMNQQILKEAFLKYLSVQERENYPNGFESLDDRLEAAFMAGASLQPPHPAEDRAVEFTEWLWKNEFYRKQVSVNPPIWKKGYYNELEYTTSELYKIFDKETSSNGEGKE